MIGQLAETLVGRGDSYADIEVNSEIYCAIMKAQGVQFPSANDTAMHCHANIATKLARLGSSGFSHHDSVLDIAGYAILWLADLKRRDWREDNK